MGLSNFDHGLVLLYFSMAFIVFGLVIGLLNYLVWIARIQKEQSIRMKYAADQHELNVATAINQAAIRLSQQKVDLPSSNQVLSESQKNELVAAVMSDDIQEVKEALMIAINDLQ